MILVPVKSRRIQRSTWQSAPYVAGLLRDLGRLQLHGRVLTADVGGEDDVRLQAWCDSGHRTVEILWCGPDEALPTRLDAVRVVGDERNVWRSPDGPGYPAKVVRFVRDLLLLEDAALLRRYQRLG